MNLRLAPTAPSGAINVLHSLIRAHGLEVANFEVEEHASSGLADLLGGNERIVAVKCRSNGEERLYATGPDSAWLGAFMMDLGSGHFGKAVRLTV
jgi:hypothetical protein